MAISIRQRDNRVQIFGSPDSENEGKSQMATLNDTKFFVSCLRLPCLGNLRNDGDSLRILNSCRHACIYSATGLTLEPHVNLTD